MRSRKRVIPIQVSNRIESTKSPFITDINYYLTFSLHHTPPVPSPPFPPYSNTQLPHPTPLAPPAPFPPNPEATRNTQ